MSFTFNIPNGGTVHCYFIDSKLESVSIVYEDAVIQLNRKDILGKPIDKIFEEILVKIKATQKSQEDFHNIVVDIQSCDSASDVTLFNTMLKEDAELCKVCKLEGLFDTLS